MPLFAMRIEALDTEFPKLWRRLKRDSYVSLNSSYRHSQNDTVQVALPQHTTSTLRHLCACYCDIDYYKRGLNARQVRKQIQILCSIGNLPAISMTIDSGHGMWLLWLLHDESNTERAHLGAWIDNPTDHLQLLNKINAAIATRLHALGADPSAVDGARYIRTPGSWRNDRETVVRWKMHRPNGSVPTYTLKELAGSFGIDCDRRKTKSNDRTAGPSIGSTKRKAGLIALRRICLRVFRTIKKLRKGCFERGCRNFAALIYAVLLKINGFSRVEIRIEIGRMAARCRPPLDSVQQNAAIKSALKPNMQRFSYQRIADLLNVTPEEAVLVSQAIGKNFPAATHFGFVDLNGDPRAEKRRSAQREIRRLEISEIVSESSKGWLPSLRTMKALLAAKGITVSHVTIRADLVALGLAPHLEKNLDENQRERK